MKVLLDTHIWLWYLLGAKNLASKKRRILDRSDTVVWLSPISVWETLVLAQKKRIELRPNSIDWVREALSRYPVHEAPLNTEIAITSRELKLNYDDPADRFIAATAMIFELTLMTDDRRLLDTRWLSTI